MRRIELHEMPGVALLSGLRAPDHRGSFTKFFEQENYAARGFNPSFTSMAISSTRESGTIRGMHFQNPPFEEEKLITCISGGIFDVVVDLRPNSRTLGKWASFELTSNEAISLCVPSGIAHGFQTLSPETKIFYGLTSQYSPENAHSLYYADATLGIEWPLPIVQVSPKDLAGITLESAIALAANPTI